MRPFLPFLPILPILHCRGAKPAAAKPAAAKPAASKADYQGRPPADQSILKSAVLPASPMPLFPPDWKNDPWYESYVELKVIVKILFYFQKRNKLTGG